MTVKDKIILHLQKIHPQGIDDDALAEVLALNTRQDANANCNKLTQKGLVLRKIVNGKYHNFWNKDKIDLVEENSVWKEYNKEEPWFWEGNVQTTIVLYLEQLDYNLIFAANTGTRQRGKDIKAEINGDEVWISVKGYPEGTKNTPAPTQAGHYFKDVVFDIIKYREENKTIKLGIGFPDFPKYRTLAKTITWFKPVADFKYYWVNENGEVSEE